MGCTYPVTVSSSSPIDDYTASDYGQTNTSICTYIDIHVHLLYVHHCTVLASLAFPV